MLYLCPLSSAILISIAFASEISFQSIPACAKTSCFPYHSSKIGCTSLTKNCFCNALAPVNCAASNCTGNDWYAVEDWYSTQCPGEPPLVSMDPEIPLAARKCIRAWIVPDQCHSSITRNCFCRLGNVTEAISKCVQDEANAGAEQANEVAKNFYTDTCVYEEDASGEQRPGGASTKEEIISSPEPDEDGSPLGKIFGIVGGVASFITIVSTIWCCVAGCCCSVSLQFLKVLKTD